LDGRDESKSSSHQVVCCEMHKITRAHDSICKHKVICGLNFSAFVFMISLCCRCEGKQSGDVRCTELEFEENQKKITIQIREIPFEQGGLGCRLFPSAIMLCDWMTKMSTLFTKDTSVLEIGSGVGACGLMAAHIGCQRVVLSDFYIPLLQNLAVSACTAKSLCPNVDIAVNFLDWNDDYCRLIDSLEPDQHKLKAHLVCKDAVMMSYERQHHEGTVLGNKDLVMDLHPHLGFAEAFDVILATDVLYENIQADLLAGVLNLRLRKSAICLMILPIRDCFVMQRMIKLQIYAGMKVSICSVEVGLAHSDWWNMSALVREHLVRSSEQGLEQLLNFIDLLSSRSDGGTAGVFLCIEKV
jgi:predicted nicotinamide N-methyase